MGNVRTEKRKRNKARKAQHDHDALLSMICGSLRSCIDAHGPITHQSLSSAAKRVLQQLVAETPILPEGRRNKLHRALIGEASDGNPN